MAATSLPDYDPRVIEQFAENLYKKATAFVVGSVAIGGALGAAFGSVPLTSLGASWPIPSIFGFATMLVGGIFGAAIGYVIGDTRSFGYRLQAQAALCQLQTERNTAVIAKALMARVPATATRAPAPPAPKPQPQAQVAPPPVVEQTPPPAAPPAPPVQERVAPQLEAPEAPAPPPVTPPVSAARVA